LICDTCSYGSTREAQVNFFMEIAEKCDFLVAPSLAVWKLYSAHVPHLASKITVAPLQEFLPVAVSAAKRESLTSETSSTGNPTTGMLKGRLRETLGGGGYRKMRVGFVGPESLHKGWDFWQTLNLTKKLKERYQFVQLGGKPIHVPGDAEHIEFEFTPGNPHAALGAFERAKLDVLLVLSRVPETYSFTLYESLASQTPVLCFAVSGNVAYEVSKSKEPIGRVFLAFKDLLEFLEGDEFTVELVHAWKQGIAPFRLAYSPPVFLKERVL